MADRADGGEGSADQDHLGDVLRVVNSIQAGIAAGLSFAAIVDLAGDELRVLLGSDDIGIVWLERSTNLLHSMYVYEHRVRLGAADPVGLPSGRMGGRAGYGGGLEGTRGH
jgi:hypothetical protein